MVLSNGDEHFRRVYINNPSSGEWEFGVVYEDHENYTRPAFPKSAKLWTKVYFKQGGIQKPIRLETGKYEKTVEFPTHHLHKVTVDMPKLETIN